MAIKIGFDMLHRPEEPTFVLAKKNGDKIGLLTSQKPVVMDSMTAPPEIFFGIYKYLNGKKDHLWDELTNFKLVWCKEWDTWFEVRVETDETDNHLIVKNVYGKRLGEAELSQILLHDIEINTETDISREEYDKDFPTLLYREDHPEASLLHRLLEKAPHYSIAHVDASIAKEQRTFTFDDKTIYEALQEIGEELQCFFTFDADFKNGKLERTVSVYDLQAHCNHCGHRGDFIEECPKCGSKDVNAGYGKDTTIFITADAFAKNIQFSTNTDSVKNCFKLKAGDDLMTETIRNCNPNGSDYIWYISPTSRKEMSQELQEKLAEYDNNHAYYQNDYVSNLDTALSTKYNQLVTKYKEYYKQINNHDLSPIATPIKGYPALMTAYYDTIDLAHFLKSSLMPNAAMDDTDADAQLALLTTANLSPVALTDITNLSNKIASVDSAVLAMAKVVVDSTRYQIKIASSSISGTTWSGKFTVTNYSDEEDTATSTSAVSVTINSDYKTFVTQKMQKALKKKDVEDLSISGLFKSDIFLANFKNKIRQYGLNSLTRIHDACQACIDILIEQGIANKETWSGQNPNLYNDLYLPHYNKLHATEEEISVRQSEINTILGVYDSEGDLVTDGLQTVIIKQKNDIQDKLDIKKSLGENLWLELNTFRREQTFSNDNYISDGKTNTELFEKALEFIDIANNELIKSVEMNHSMTVSLHNVLILDKFQPLAKLFEIGNWMRVRVDDKVYRLRLMEYKIDYTDLESMYATFSDVMCVDEFLKLQQNTIQKSIDMGKSYDYVQRQAKQGAKGNEVVKDWTTNGLDATNTKIIGGADNQTQTWDEHGMLFRKYDSITDKYDDEQLKIINSTLAVTDDNWRSAKTAIGKIIYYDPDTKTQRVAYGLIGEVLVGNIVLSNQLGIHNESSTLKFTVDGLRIEDINGTNIFTVNPNDLKQLIKITNKTKGDVFYVDENGHIHIWENDVILTEEGMDFYSDGIPIGRMVSTGLKSYPDEKGLHFTLQKDGSYLCWAVINPNNPENNEIKLAYYRDGVVPGYKEGLHLGTDLYCNGRTLQLSNGVKAKGTQNGTTVTIADGNSFAFADKGNILICRFSPTKVEFNKDIDMRNYNILNSSDARLKTNIESTEVNALDTLNQIELKQFDWIENDNHEDIGMIAQQLQNILPDLVHENESNGKLSIKTDRFIPYLIKAIQELSNKINSLNGSEPSMLKSRHASHNSWENISLEEKNKFVEKIKVESVIPETTTPKPMTIPVGR